MLAYAILSCSKQVPFFFSSSPAMLELISLRSLLSTLSNTRLILWSRWLRKNCSNSTLIVLTRMAEHIFKGKIGKNLLEFTNWKLERSLSSLPTHKVHLPLWRRSTYRSPTHVSICLFEVLPLFRNISCLRVCIKWLYICRSTFIFRFTHFAVYLASLLCNELALVFLYVEKKK